MTPAVSEEMLELAWGSLFPSKLSVISITKDDLRFALDVALSTLAPSAAPSDETGWLIELKGQTPTWFQLSHGGDEWIGDDWTPDASKALRFARKADAQAYIDHIGWTEAFASEHMWCGPPRNRAAPAADAPFEFDRYINGTLMAEGVSIAQQDTLECATRAAALIAPRGPNGEAPVLVYRPRAALSQPQGELREALAPFVKWLDALDEEFSDHADDTIAGGLKGGQYVTFGDLRRARAALAGRTAG